MRVLFPGRRLVAIYGHPGDDNLGVARRATGGSTRFSGRSEVAVLAITGSAPKWSSRRFEIITTIASSEAGADGDYSTESPLDHIRPWVDAAAAAGFYVVLDLQPGYTDFLTQAMRYEEYWAQPHVGLALDPEWRRRQGNATSRDIGQVSADEVNKVATWLADLTRRHHLPQKLLVLHQFRHDMLPDRFEHPRTDPELALVVQMDGFGHSRDQARDVAGAITARRPRGDALRLEEFL